jgi:hypothetical protein
MLNAHAPGACVVLRSNVAAAMHPVLDLPEPVLQCCAPSAANHMTHYGIEVALSYWVHGKNTERPASGEAPNAVRRVAHRWRMKTRQAPLKCTPGNRSAPKAMYEKKEKRLHGKEACVDLTPSRVLLLV